MKYELMFPNQIEKAIAENWPAALPLGVLEYHSQHLSVGVDTILPHRALEQIEKNREDLVILPPFCYGAASYAVASPEKTGTINISSRTLHMFAYEFFANLLRIGFKNIHVFICHQSENFVEGMPTDLAFKLGARDAIFEYMEKTRGEGWWGKEDMQDYYSKNALGKDPFNWIRFHPLRNPDTRKDYPGDHSGKMETSLMMSLCPEGVNMKLFSKENWYSREAADADKEFGDRVLEMITNYVEQCLRGNA